MFESIPPRVLKRIKELLLETREYEDRHGKKKKAPLHSYEAIAELVTTEQCRVTKQAVAVIAYSERERSPKKSRVIRKQGAPPGIPRPGIGGRPAGIHTKLGNRSVYRDRVRQLRFSDEGLSLQAIADRIDKEEREAGRHSGPKKVLTKEGVRWLLMPTDTDGK